MKPIPGNAEPQLGTAHLAKVLYFRGTCYIVIRSDYCNLSLGRGRVGARRSWETLPDARILGSVYSQALKQSSRVAILASCTILCNFVWRA